MNYNKKYIAIVLCAGFGTRLKPLTDFIPKVVCPLIDKPFAFYNIEKFFKAGFETIHCNTHYLPEIVKTELISACKNFGYEPNRIRFWNEENILETGGGIARIFKKLSEEDAENEKKDLIIVSGDVVADFPLTEMITRWENRSEDELALLCTKKMEEFRKDGTYISEDSSYILGFGEKFGESAADKKLQAKVFTNHQIVSGNIVKNSLVEKKSSIDLFYRKMIQLKKKVINFNYGESLYWFNIGNAREYLEGIRFFANREKLKSCINYASSMPERLKSAIDLYEKNICQEKENCNFLNDLQNIDDKVFLSFRENKNKQSKYVSLNKVFNKETLEDIIYFYI